MLVPMQSRTQKPFHTTNLVVFGPESAAVDGGNNKFVAHGEALIVDPGCKHQFHDEVLHIIANITFFFIIFLIVIFSHFWFGGKIFFFFLYGNIFLVVQNYICQTLCYQCWFLSHT